MSVEDLIKSVVEPLTPKEEQALARYLQANKENPLQSGPIVDAKPESIEVVSSIPVRRYPATSVVIEQTLRKTNPRYARSSKDQHKKSSS